MTTTNNAIVGGDDRLKRDDGAGRDSRASADSERTQKDGTGFSAAERRTNFRDEWTANALPNPPAIAGFHTCWLSSTSSSDPIHKRMRMGYERVEVDEVPGFEHYKMKSGEFEGFIAVNEMILFKVPMALYQEMMAYFHHEKPMEEEQMLKDNNPAFQDANTRKLEDAKDDADGFGTLAKSRHAPVFN